MSLIANFWVGIGSLALAVGLLVANQELRLKAVGRLGVAAFAFASVVLLIWGIRIG